MDERDWIEGHRPTSDTETPGGDQNVQGDGEPIPSQIRDAVSDIRQRLGSDAPDDDIVQEYEARYYGTGRARLEEPPHATQEPPSGVIMPPKPKRMFDPVEVDQNERKWATLAHASTLITALFALPSGGLLVLLTMFAPLMIYFAFRKRSEFVAFHALQAFTLQLVGTIGFLAVVTVGTIVAFILLMVSIPLLIVFLLGLVLAVLTVIAWVLLMVISLAMPLGMVIYSVIAMFDTWKGRNYRIPYIARWVESQMYSS